MLTPQALERRASAGDTRMTQKRKETLTPSGVMVVETVYDGGFTEISLYKPKNGTIHPGLQNRQQTAVNSRQIVGGKWVVHTDLRSRAFVTRVKRDAINWAIYYANEGKGNHGDEDRTEN
jgi:hypothetical protein